jgi:hypothetical protein
MKYVLLLIMITLFSCKKTMNLEGKFFKHESGKRNIYLYFLSNKFCNQLFLEGESQRINSFSYLRTNKGITFYKFDLYFDGEKHLSKPNFIYSLEVYSKDKCLYFDIDYSGLKYCEINRDDLPKSVFTELTKN